MTLLLIFDLLLNELLVKYLTYHKEKDSDISNLLKQPSPGGTDIKVSIFQPGFLIDENNPGFTSRDYLCN